MYYIYFNSGTTNTRGYLLQKTAGDYQIVDNKRANIGSRDSSIAGDKEVLIKGLYQLYNQLLENNNLDDSQIQEVMASGMITSTYGLKKVPHLSTPVSAEKLYKNIYYYKEPNYFKRNLGLIRGVKTIPRQTRLEPKMLAEANMVRGEEIEIFGIMSSLNARERDSDLAIFMPGSHTHIIRVKKGVIVDILSNFTGELFHALKEETILSDAIDFKADIKQDMLNLGFKYLKQEGITRALYLPNIMRAFTDIDTAGKTSFLEGIINGGVVISFINKLAEDWQEIEKVIIAGNSNINKVYQILLDNSDIDISLETIVNSSDKSFAVRGFTQILENN